MGMGRGGGEEKKRKTSQQFNFYVTCLFTNRKIYTDNLGIIATGSLAIKYISNVHNLDHSKWEVSKLRLNV